MANRSGYDAMDDRQLAHLCSEYGIRPARRLDGQFYFDREHAIQALVNYDAGQGQTRSDSTRSGLPASQKDERTVRAARREEVVMPILKSKGWTKGKWATVAGVGKNCVYEYLDGRRRLSDENRKAMAEVLGLRPEDLPD